AQFETDFSLKQFKDTSRNHRLVKYILSKIEKYKYHNEIDFDSELYTIEHILPESADENWGDFNQDEINRSVYRIGNLTLLEKALNRDADVRSFPEKKTFYQQSNCNITKNITIHYDTWNEDRIASRQANLAKDAKSIWKIQELNQ
ncbi:hypothetical protein EZS27_039798, partial [termite gut metagenome]